MKTPLSLLPALAGLISFSGTAGAQDVPRPEGGGRGGDWRERMIRDFDKDGDGKLSDEEQKAAREAGEKRMMERFDADKDGKLSDTERGKMREDRQKERAARPGNEAVKKVETPKAPDAPKPPDAPEVPDAPKVPDAPAPR